MGFSFDQGNPGIVDEALCGKVWQYLTLKLTFCRLSTTDNNKAVDEGCSIEPQQNHRSGATAVEPYIAALAVSVAGRDAIYQGVWR
ncbi:hypothetical protein GCT13_29020 [Paraburkholderia sp. CNPSo 3157]|uniref:Uncharacterized protein n=1 Tax=Paraburkholderia franconis TaxID=2654983 RepID=A0A7X1TIW1_9BURK|nr:hypothetical protein [Paraburkholderia franconis]MPW20801.1 hypothetical protein [Paraburkholderia franconis]